MKAKVLSRGRLGGALLCYGLASLTASSAAAQSPRFGIIDIQRIILNVDEGKSARAELEKEIKVKEADLLKHKQELDKLNEEWKSQAALLSEEARMRKQQEFQEKFMELRNSEQTFREEIKRKEMEATQKIAQKAFQMVDGMAKAKGLDGVWETNSSGLVYLKEPVDLTGEVIAGYNKGNQGAKKSGGGTEAKKAAKP